MTQTVVDQRGRVLIPEDVREDAGFDEGTVVSVETQAEGIVIKPVREAKRGWKQLCGINPTGPINQGGQHQQRSKTSGDRLKRPSRLP